jgi:hypothetical protein
VQIPGYEQLMAGCVCVDGTYIRKPKAVCETYIGKPKAVVALPGL